MRSDAWLVKERGMARQRLGRVRAAVRAPPLRFKIVLVIAVLTAAMVAWALPARVGHFMLLLALCYGPVAIWRKQRSVFASLGVAAWGLAAILFVAALTPPVTFAIVPLLLLPFAVVAAAHARPLARNFVPCRTVAWTLLWAVPATMFTWRLASSGQPVFNYIVGWLLTFKVLGWRIARADSHIRVYSRQQARAPSVTEPHGEQAACPTPSASAARGSQPPGTHLVFTGHAGTGKTTVARILGRIFAALRQLVRPEVIARHAPAPPRHTSRHPGRARDGAAAKGEQALLRLPGRLRAGRVIALIPAHNEAACIAETISSLWRQTCPPDEVIVVSDNSSDATVDQGVLHGAKVFVTAGNTARKAGALNLALEQTLPGLAREDLVLVMDADSQLAPGWIGSATDALARDPEVVGVSGTYTGEDGPGLLRQLQRNEFVRASRLVRRRADLWVLSGTGTMFRVPVLREVARQRGRRLPGVPGEYYDSTSITEDYEITLALKTLGHRCLCPPGCTAVTELMPTWRHLFRQRLRWQSGTLTALRRYGFTQATWTNWVRQAFFYGRYCSQIACWVVLICSLVARLGFNMPGWVLGMLLAIYLERIITARGAGRKGVLIAALLFPEWWYGMFDGLYLFQALNHQLTRRDVSWNHVVKDGADHAASNRHSVLPAGRPVPVRQAGDG